MHYNARKSISYWTEKHDQFCLENGFTPAAKLLWQWIIRQKEEEPDLKEFNYWVAKHRGKPYCRPTIKAAFNQLVECRVIQLVKKFTWNLVRIVTRTLDDLFPKKKLRSESQIYDLPTSNPSESNEGFINSNQSSLTVEDKVEILENCANVGILFNPEHDTDLYQHSKEEIAIALEFYGSLTPRKKRSIINLQGWFLTCLERQFWNELTQEAFDFQLAQLKKQAAITR